MENVKGYQRSIQGGDIVKLKHAETGGYLCIDDELKLKNGLR
jgi:hypothetical protein